MTARAPREQPVTAPPIPHTGHPCYAMLAARTPASVIDFQHQSIGAAQRMHLGESVWLALSMLDGKVPLMRDKGVIGFPYRHGIAARDLGVTVKKIRQWMGVLVKSGYVASIRPVTVKDMFWGLVVTIDPAALSRDNQGGRDPDDAGLIPAGGSG